MAQTLQYMIGGLTAGSIYALVAVGFILAYNVSKVVNFAQGEFVMLGGLTTWFFLKWFPFHPAISGVLAIVCVSVLSLVFYILFIEGRRQADHLTITLITLGLSMMYTGLAAIIFDRNPHSLPPFSGSEVLQVFGTAIAPQTLWVLGIAITLVVLLSLFLSRTSTGRLMVACAENEELLRLSGANTKKLFRISFAMGGLIGSIGGIIIAPISFVSYDIGGLMGIKGLIAAVFGGMSSYYGALVGGLGIGLMESLTAGFISSKAKDLMAFSVLIIVLLVKPTGLLGRSE